MRKRLYFILPNTTRAKEVVNRLLLARIEERHIHVVAKEGTPLEDLPEATVLQKSDAIRGAGLGLSAGSVTGAIAGTFVLLFPPHGVSTGYGIVLAMSLLGAVMGIWVSGMIGSSAPSIRLRSFESDIERGKVLLIVDVLPHRVDEICEALRQHYPDVAKRVAERTVASMR
ncbi:MAG: DUF1269 domain-containing protein [Sulfurifustis sp.]